MINPEPMLSEISLLEKRLAEALDRAYSAEKRLEETEARLGQTARTLETVKSSGLVDPSDTLYEEIESVLTEVAGTLPLTEKLGAIEHENAALREFLNTFLSALEFASSVPPLVLKASEQARELLGTAKKNPIYARMKRLEAVAKSAVEVLSTYQSEVASRASVYRELSRSVKELYE